MNIRVEVYDSDSKRSVYFTFPCVRIVTHYHPATVNRRGLFFNQDDESLNIDTTAYKFNSVRHEEENWLDVSLSPRPEPADNPLTLLTEGKMPCERCWDEKGVHEPSEGQLNGIDLCKNCAREMGAPV